MGYIMRTLKKNQFGYLKRCCYDLNWDIDERSEYCRYLVNGERIVYIYKSKTRKGREKEVEKEYFGSDRFALVKPLEKVGEFEVVLCGTLDVIETYLNGRLSLREQLLTQISYYHEHVTSHPYFMKNKGAEMTADKAIVSLYDSLKSGKDCLLQFEHCDYGRLNPANSAEARWICQAVSSILYSETPSDCKYGEKDFEWHYNFKFNNKE